MVQRAAMAVEVAGGAEVMALGKARATGAQEAVVAVKEEAVTPGKGELMAAAHLVVAG